MTKHTTKHRHVSHRTSGNESSGHGATAAYVAEEDLFAQQKVPSLLALYAGAKSALSSMMAASNMMNPFSDLYSAISSRCVSPATSMTATMFFLFAREPAGKPMELSMCRDATVKSPCQPMRLFACGFDGKAG